MKLSNMMCTLKPTVMHLGIIPDGNRRFAKENNIPLPSLVDYWIGHVIRPFIKHLLDNVSITVDGDNCVVTSESPLREVRHLSLYVLSSENMNRQDGSQELGFELIRKIYAMKPTDFDERLDEGLKKLNQTVSFTPVGELHRLPADIQAILQELRTKNTGNHFTMTIAIGYDSAKDALGLYGVRPQPDIDLVFRSGREQRLSGFFPRQTMYSELVFSDTLWPAITPEDLEDAVREFRRRHRRFGK